VKEMRRWIGISSTLIFLFVILGGCGGSGDKYIGKWVSEKETIFTSNGKKHLILEIKKDGTWEWEIPPTFKFANRGEWIVNKGRIELYAGKIKQVIPHLVYEMEIEGNKLIDRRVGMTLVKQD
jgi:hypothetical protein